MLVILSDRFINDRQKRFDTSSSSPGHSRIMGTTQSLKKTNPLILGQSVQTSNAGISNAALRSIEDSFDTYFIHGVGYDAEISNGIFDLTAVIETSSADYFVWNTKTHEDFFNHTTLGIRAIKHRHLTPRATLSMKRLE